MGRHHQGRRRDRVRVPLNDISRPGGCPRSGRPKRPEPCSRAAARPPRGRSPLRRARSRNRPRGACACHRSRLEHPGRLPCRHRQRLERASTRVVGTPRISPVRPRRCNEHRPLSPDHRYRGDARQAREATHRPPPGRSARRLAADALIPLSGHTGPVGHGVLASMVREARKPMLSLRPADGAIGAHQRAVQVAHAAFADRAREAELRPGFLRRAVAVVGARGPACPPRPQHRRRSSWPAGGGSRPCAGVHHIVAADAPRLRPAATGTAPSRPEPPPNPGRRTSFIPRTDDPT